MDLDKFKEELLKLPKHYGILPHTNWRRFEINHGNESDRKLVFKEIGIQVGRCTEGIYIYEKDGEILYIGRGKNLAKRLKTHFLESFSKRTSLSKNHRDFFSKYSGRLKIYYIESKGEINKILEWILTIKLKPVFGDKQI